MTGIDTVGMMNDGAVGYRLGKLLPGEKKAIALYICAAHALKDVKELARKAKASNAMGVSSAGASSPAADKAAGFADLKKADCRILA